MKNGCGCAQSGVGWGVGDGPVGVSVAGTGPESGPLKVGTAPGTMVAGGAADDGPTAPKCGTTPGAANSVISTAVPSSAVTTARGSQDTPRRGSGTRVLSVCRRAA